MNRPRVALVAGVLALCAGILLVLHGPVLAWPFISDDYIFLNVSRDWHDLFRAFVDLPNYFRPLGREMYFFAGYHVAGPRPLAFHLVNFGILLTTLALVAVLGTRLAGPRAGLLMALTYALLYPHRVQMAWVSCSQDLLATVLATAAVLAHVRGRKRLSAGLFLAALFGKESVVPLPLILFVWEARRASRPGFTPRILAGFNATRGLWIVLAAWAVVVLTVRSGLHAWAAGQGVTPVADVSIHLESFGEGIKSALLTYVYLDQPWPLLWPAVISIHVPWLALVLVALAVTLAFRQGNASARKAPERGTGGAWRLGLGWCVLGALPVALAGHHFSAYYVSFSAVGFALLAGDLLARAPAPAAGVVFVAAAILNAAANDVKSFRVTRAQVEPSGVSYITISRLGYEKRFIDSLEAPLFRDPPPRGATIYLSNVPHYMTLATAGDRAPKVWFNDPTLSLASISTYRPGANSGPTRFLRFDTGTCAFTSLPEPLVDAIVRGEQLLATGQPLEARAALIQALNLVQPGVNDFERIELENSLGVAALATGEPEAAAIAWKRVLAVDPVHRGALLNLAGLEAQAGNFTEARRLVLRSLDNQPKDRDALVLLVRIDRAMGNEETARSDFERLRQAYPAVAESLAGGR